MGYLGNFADVLKSKSTIPHCNSVHYMTFNKRLNYLIIFGGVIGSDLLFTNMTVTSAIVA